MMAISSPALIAAVGVAIDFGTYSMKMGQLQAAADAAAIAATKELALAPSTTQSIQSVAVAYVDAQLGQAPAAAPAPKAMAMSGAAPPPPTNGVTTEVVIDKVNGTVKVKVTEYWSPFFAHFLGADITPIKSNATAQLAGDSKICVLTLEPSAFAAIYMVKNATIQANGCGLYSNSTNSSGIYMNAGTSISASIICSAGGVYGKSSAKIGNVLTDCPVTPDPLASLAAYKFGGCDYQIKKITSGVSVLNPGVYCGGIEVGGNAKVTFNPGNYVVKDGFFNVKGSASVKGKNVAFFLTGALGLISFTNDATIDLSGAETGELAGLLFFEDPTIKSLRTHYISANHANNLTGTIYLPNSNLSIDPNAMVGDQSAYTAIVVKRLTVDNGPSLVLNSNYSATKVPVPDGIHSAAQVVLSE